MAQAGHDDAMQPAIDRAESEIEDDADDVEISPQHSAVARAAIEREAPMTRQRRQQQLKPKEKPRRTSSFLTTQNIIDAALEEIGAEEVSDFEDCEGIDDGSDSDSCSIDTLSFAEIANEKNQIDQRSEFDSMPSLSSFHLNESSQNSDASYISDDDSSVSSNDDEDEDSIPDLTQLQVDEETSDECSTSHDASSESMKHVSSNQPKDETSPSPSQFDNANRQNNSPRWVPTSSRDAIPFRERRPQ